MRWRMAFSCIRFLKNITGAWVTDQQVGVKGGKIEEYRVRMKVTFILE
jgi:dodecin